jgi:hypothetical protein
MKHPMTRAALAIGLVLGSATAEAKGAGKVSFLQGKAEVQHENESTARALAVGAGVAEGDTLITRDNARMELALQDGSRLRLAANTKVTLTEAHFGPNKERNVGVAMWVGRLWAKVAKAVGGEDTFEVGTRNAVAGVRGTSFAVAASEDLSAIVRVYTGSVGVRKGEGGQENFAKPAHSKRQVPGPTRVDKKQWEEIIASAMKQIKITSIGDISPAEDFEDTGEDLKWAMWNQQRDKEVVR